MAHDDSPESRIYWKPEEKLQLAEFIVKNFVSGDADFELNRHHILRAQYGIPFPEDRQRTSVQPQNVLEIQKMIDDILSRRATALNEQIIAAWKDHLKVHGCSPIERCHRLQQKVIELEILLEDATNPAQQANVTAANVLQLKPAEQKQSCRIILANPHLSQMPRQLMEARMKELGVDFVWVEAKDDRELIRKRAKGRHAILMSGSLNTQVAAALRQSADTFVEARGGNTAFESSVMQVIRQVQADLAA
jgi:hypothetical protein